MCSSAVFLPERAALPQLVVLCARSHISADDSRFVRNRLFVHEVFFENVVEANRHGHALAFGRGVELANKPVLDFWLVHLVTFLISKNLGEAYQAGGKSKGWRTCCERQICAGAERA